jgi:hypothetical protein
MSRASWRRVEDRAVAADDRLTRSVEAGGWLVLSVPPRWLARASQCLAVRPVARIDVESILLTGMRAFAAQHNVQWATVLAADVADRDSNDWRNLSRVVDAGLAAVRATIDASGPAVLLVNAGVLARYDSAMLDELRDAVRTATAESSLHTVWLLVPWADQDLAPMLDNIAIPVMAPQWLPLPPEWILMYERHVEGGAA